MNKIIFAAALSLFVLPLFATELKVVTINSNIDRDVTEFFLDIVEDGSLDGMRFVTKNGRGVVTQDRHATVEEVVDSGIVLFHENGRDAVILRVKNFDRDNGGEVIVDYLYSGINNSRRQLKLGIKKTDGDFFLHDTNSNKVDKLKVYGNWAPILGLIGISSIRAVNLSDWWN